MDEYDPNDIFGLITSLCEQFSNDRDKIKKNRSKCYEILLGKTCPKHVRFFKDLEGTDDPTCNLTAWQYILSNDYGLVEHANDIKASAENVEALYGADTKGYKNALQFLMCLRNIPTENDKKFDLSSLPTLNLNQKFSDIFKLPSHLIESESKTNQKAVKIKSVDCMKKDSSLSFLTAKSFGSDILKDDGYFSPINGETDIWETASRSFSLAPFSERRTWEEYGYSEPDKEKPFLTELGDLSSLWVENLPSLYFDNNFKNNQVFKAHTITRKDFVKDIKYLLVGMVSDTFGYNEHGEFYLAPCIMIEGITPNTLKSFCDSLIFAGTCYKALIKISTPNSETGKYKYHGYIFTELCIGIKRYLQFYRTACLSIPDSTSLLALDEKTYNLRRQVVTLASICRIGPYSETEEIPHGVALLNYLYQNILAITEKKIVVVLYSIFYACCQVYFSRFLQQWILEGNVNDLYGEFFIKPNLKYVATRGRTYWSRSYSLKEDIVPDFLIDFKNELLYCGKTMNLLKLCVPQSKLCQYLMGTKPPIISCCITSEQLLNLKQVTTNYYLEVSALFGTKFSLQKLMERSKEVDPQFLRLVAKKRSLTLKRLDLERKKTVMELKEKRQEELSMLKEQYDMALEQKQSRIVLEIERDLKQAREIDMLEEKREKLIEIESQNLIDYYTELCKAADDRREKIEKNIKSLKEIYFDDPNQSDHFESISDESLLKVSNSNDSLKTNSSASTFYSVDTEKREDIKNQIKELDEIIEISEKSEPSEKLEILDQINANTKTEKNDKENGNEMNTPAKNIEEKPHRTMQETFEMARKIKQKVLTEEMGLSTVTNLQKKPPLPPQSQLTDAQKNKLRVLTSEFGIDLKPDNMESSKVMTIAQLNKTRVLGTHKCLYGDLDNQNMNFTNNIKKSKSLTLNLSKSKTEFEKPVPMSVDSTPNSEVPLSTISTPQSTIFSLENFSSAPTTAETIQTDDGHGFVFKDSEKSILNPTTLIFTKRVTKTEANGVSTNCLKLFISESVLVPLITQTKLVNNELMRYFIEDLGYLKHLNSLRDYFFMQDGEFGRNMTENLFEKLYDANFPIELINCRTLQYLVFGALDISSKYQEHSGNLSFKINTLPKCFDLGNPDVLDCLSLTYKVNWPLNILLPADTIKKYDEIFKFLLKLNRIQWVLKKTFMELKILAKETGKKEIYLMTSPQYRKLHQCRHVMMHFIQTLQNYIVGDVLQSSWENFEKRLLNVTNLDELYSSHTIYIKNILFMCLLNQKTLVLKNIIQKIFIVILKFYDYLRSRTWNCVEGVYIHPNFAKLESIFRNFEEFLQYFFKVCKKVAKSGYQRHLIQLLDMLDINNYYSVKNN